jgi:type II secretory pathway component PulJ
VRNARELEGVRRFCVVVLRSGWTGGGIGASRDGKKAVIGWRMRGQVLFDP